MMCPECSQEVNKIGKRYFRCTTKLEKDNCGSSHYIIRCIDDDKNAVLMFYKKSNNYTQGYCYVLEYDTEFEDCDFYDYDDKFLLSIKISFDKLCELIKLDYMYFLERIKLYQTFS